MQQEDQLLQRNHASSFIYIVQKKLGQFHFHDNFDKFRPI